MLLRYSALTAVVIAVALVTGYVVHRVSGTTSYRTACQFQMALPATAATTIVASTDVLVYNRRLALDEIFRAPAAQIFASAAQATAIPAGKIAAAQEVLPASDSSFDVNVKYANPKDAVKIANALCNRYVSQISKQVAAEYDAEAAQIRGQLHHLVAQEDALDKSVHGKPTALYFHERNAIKAAIDRAKQFLSVTYSSPRFAISVLSTASGATAHSTKPSLSKSLIVAAAAGLLLSFLLILVTEMVRGRREEMMVRS